MNSSDPIIFRELPVIRKIIQDETWLEGERRGCHVPASDPVVRERVCQIVLRIGQHLRETLAVSLAESASASSPSPEALASVSAAPVHEAA